MVRSLYINGRVCRKLTLSVGMFIGKKPRNISFCTKIWIEMSILRFNKYVCVWALRKKSPKHIWRSKFKTYVCKYTNGNMRRLLNFQRWVTSLTKNQHTKRQISNFVNWPRREMSKVPKSDFQSQFSLSKIIGIFNIPRYKNPI